VRRPGFHPAPRRVYPVPAHSHNIQHAPRKRKRKKDQPVQKAQEQQQHSSGSYYLIRQLLLYSQGASEFWLRDQYINSSSTSSRSRSRLAR
jgi:hypothetical protein